MPLLEKIYWAHTRMTVMDPGVRQALAVAPAALGAGEEVLTPHSGLSWLAESVLDAFSSTALTYKYRFIFMLLQ